jgi:glycosyltransferase involved in cell wall biosynthesis
MKIFVIIATYNEKENIARLTERVLGLPFPIEIAVVDDNSPDGTGLLADELSRKDARIHVLHRPGKLGLGTAHIAGFRYALDKKAGLILTMDADFSHEPSYIPAILEAAKSFDVVIGSKYVKGGAMVNSPLYRRLLSRCANRFAKAALGLKANDCTAGFRCYKAAVLESIDLGNVFSNGYSFLIELLYRIQLRGFSVGEVPIQFVDRRFGVSKISKSEVFKALVTVGKLAGGRYQ